METLPARSKKTQTTEITSVVWIELSSIRTIGPIVLLKYEAIIWKIRKHSQKIGTIEGYHSYPTNRGEIRPGRH